MEKLKADLHSKETELNQQVATFTEKESKLKVKLLKYQKSLEKVEKHHKDELLALERRHADKLASLQDQLRQLSLKSSKSSDENSQVKRFFANLLPQHACMFRFTGFLLGRHVPIYRTFQFV